ncbi:hypothetical protein [Pendulispora albinea]|uniref:Uncharacterized protein n=1 Tax=Pendulispora albinea TaxID=2741071 RepID=A0ABZ2M013_9BACT
MKYIQWTAMAATLAAGATMAAGCSSSSPDPGPSCVMTSELTPAARSGNLLRRAYVASRDSGNVTVIDLDTLEIVGSVNTCSKGYHMVELNADFTKVYASGTEEAKIDVLDARTLGLNTQISVGAEPSHLNLSRDGKLLAIVDEKDNAVSFVDPARDVEVKRVPGFHTPHFVRFDHDNRYAYVANMGAYHVTRVDLSTLAIDATIPLDGHKDSDVMPEGEEGGFADVQIDQDGVLWGAHAESGKVLLYDTKAHKKLPEFRAGQRPWVVYAEHPFAGIEARVVPDHRKLGVSLLQRSSVGSAPPEDAPTIRTEEPESYGVNYSSLVPDKAFVMNRMRKEIAVINTRTKELTARIGVGGNTETASTTPDGKWIVAAVSDANRVVVIDAQTNAIVKTFDDVGKYPWTVTIPQGQNYCH